MKWKTYQEGDLITVRKFLWLPVTIKGETRWLEKATVTYRYEYVEDGYYFEPYSFN